MKQGQFPAILPLASLNGQNGFKIDGEAFNSLSGASVSAGGDINGDGNTDVVIGAPYYASNTGRSYVIFGGPSVGHQGLFPLASLNGTNGFKLDGEVSGDYYSGDPVCLAGDINGDGYVDVMIGSPYYASNAGRSYVVFGGPKMGGQALLPLAALNGTNGFILDGEINSEFASSSLSVIGDINGDGYTDVLIGARGYASNTGCSYVVFGGPSIAPQGLLPLANLNGANGFKLDGEVSGDGSGYSVSSAGDINGDGYADVLIGARDHASSTGRSYVVFGGPNVGLSGLLSLASLNGVNGFKLDGEANNDESGFSVGSVGDINGDGYADIVIGAPVHAGNIGRSYVVFGGPNVGLSGLLPLASLDGTNGFKLDGEAGGSGLSVSSAGDINRDGYADLLIGAPYHANNTGRSYVVFGGANVGYQGLLSLASLNGINGFKLDGEAIGDNSGSSSSTAGDINGDGVADLVIGANYHNNVTGRTYIVFGDIPPVLVNNSLSLSVGATIQLNSTWLAAYDRNHNNNTLVFVPSGVIHGQFEAVSNPNVMLSNFTQQEILAGSIQFTHDGSLVAPSYNMTVRSSGIAWTGPQAAQIDFIGAPPSQFPAILPLASLNGQNGFKLDGENSGDDSSYSVSTAGDINGDGQGDLIIGAHQYTGGNYKGRSYVLFGGSGVGSSGDIALSSLNGVNGFKLSGENNGDFSGVSVSAAGDINGDGYADLIIGAHGYPGGSAQGRSYVVFGGPGVSGSGVIALSSLNGSNGFKLDGENTNDLSGYSVSGAGDLNGDGHADLLIGAYGYPLGGYRGRSYVVFGGPGIDSSGVFSLASLTGANGFKLDGENNNDYSGWSASADGDINGDGYADLIIGAYGYPGGGYKGRSYVVFGGPMVGGGGDIALSGLNGANGFKLDGETNTDQSGLSVSISGDVNGDGYADLIIGAQGYPGGSGKGRSYVVFGGLGVGSGEVFNLSSLNGINGFKLDGENNNDNSGKFVSGAGDINGDGYADLLIGAYRYPKGNNTGRSYVVFGGPGVGSSGVLNLSNLNGVNGFKLDGENSLDSSGWSVSTAGDINGDGVGDLLIGAYAHANSTGRSYVVFGDIPPVLVQNRLTLQSGSTVSLNSTFLSAYDRNHDNNTLVFFLSDLTHGDFELVNQPGMALTNFTQTQLLAGSIQFVHDGSSIAPSYNITVYSEGIAWTGPSAANITFIPATTIAPTPTPTPTPTQTPTPSTVAPTTTSVPVTTLTPSPTPTPTFSTVVPTTTSMPVTTSTPSLTPTPSPSTATPTTIPTPVPTSTPSITPTSAPFPVLVNNQLTLGDGQTVVLSSANLQAVEMGFNAGSLTFYVSNLQNGYFSLLPTNASVTRFLQSYVQNGQIQFIHSGDHQAPSYSVVVSDGSQTTTPGPASINFIGAPSVTATPVTVTPGGSATLTTDNLNVTNTENSSSNQILFQLSNVQHGQFELNSSNTPITNFTLTQLVDQNVQLVQDNSNIAPSYSVSVTGDTGLSSAVTPVTTQLCTSLTSSLNCAPVIVRNNLWVKQGMFATLTAQNLYATINNGQSLPGSTVFYVMNINHGYFNVNGSSSSFFTQQQLGEGEVSFVNDGSNVAPSYQVAVQYAGLQTNSLAQVTLGFVNKPPYLAGALPNQIAAIGQLFTLAIGPSVFADPQGDPLILSAGIYNSTELLPDWLSFNPSTNRFSGTPTQSGVMDISVTATDPEGLSTEGEFSLTVLNQSSGGRSSLTTAIVSSVVSGSIGLFFLLLKICLQRAANKKLEEALGETGDYEQKVVRPLGRAIAQRLKITGFMNHTTQREMVEFKDAVRTLLGCLSAKGIHLEDPQMGDSRRAYLIHEIAAQSKEYFLPGSRHCCRKNCQSVVSFFTSEVTPHQINTAAGAIAEAVVKALTSQPGRESSPFSASGRGSQLFGGPRPASSANRDDLVEDKEASGVEVELESLADGLTKRSPPPLSPNSPSPSPMD